MSTRKAGRAETLLESGLRQFQQGQIEHARLSCEQALELSPRNPDVLHLLGVIALQRGDHAAAVEKLRQAVAIEPDHPAYQANLAYGYVGLKRLPEALAAFERAARLDPNDPELLVGAGNCLGMLGKTAEAEAVFRRLCGRHPEYALGWFNLANALKDQERYEEAHDLYLRVTQLEPQFAEAHCNLGVALHKLGRFEEAERAFRACLARKAEFIPAYVSLAITLNSLRRHPEAEALCREALAREPGQKNVWPVLGRALTGQGRWGEAVRCYEQAVRDYPESSDAFGDLGDVLARTGKLREAWRAFDRAFDIGGVAPHVYYAKAAALFSAGRIAEGAAAYLGRHERAKFGAEHPDMPLAMELPEDLQGREIGIIGEQGIGDELFFLRYAPPLKARGGRISYCGSPKIAGIVARNPVFERTTSNFGSFGAGHLRILAGDLPHLLAKSEASPCPPALPLQPLPDRAVSITERLRQLGPPPYLGLTWRAGTLPQEQRGHVWFLFKEIPLDGLAAALHGVKGTLLSLQRGPRPGETERLAALAGRPVHDLSAANEDLEEMLALLAVMDEYVGVSSTNMHLRASIGKTARVLVPWPAEWRWMAKGEESPWFPGFRVYRQDLDGNWTEALTRLRDDLLAAFGHH